MNKRRWIDVAAFIVTIVVIVYAISRDVPKPLPAQPVEVQVVATYLNEKGLWITCVKFQDNTRCELQGRLANEGEKFQVWHRGKEIMLQDPN